MTVVIFFFVCFLSVIQIILQKHPWKNHKLRRTNLGCNATVIADDITKNNNAIGLQKYF